jgi:hypothetical protein
MGLLPIEELALESAACLPESDDAGIISFQLGQPAIETARRIGMIRLSIPLMTNR